MSAEFSPGMSSAGFFDLTSHMLWVSKAGSDSYGDGTLGRPFRTVNRACTEVRNRADATTSTRYAIFVGPGDFVEDLVMSDWTYVVGASVRATQINFNSFIFGPEFAVNVDHQCGFEGLSFISNLTIDFITAASQQGKIQFVNVRATPYAVAVNALTNTNQSRFENCILADVTQNGAYCALWSCTTRDLSVNATPTFLGQCNCQSSTIDGDLTLVADVAFHASIRLYASPVTGMTTLNGALADVHLTSTPIAFRNGVTLIGGALEPRFVLTGAKGGNAALASVCTELASSGGFVDTTT